MRFSGSSMGLFWLVGSTVLGASLALAESVFTSRALSTAANRTKSPYRWLNAPDQLPSLPSGSSSEWLERPDGARIWHAQWSAKSPANLDPVVFLHGGLASSDWMGNQIAHILKAHPNRNVIAIDSRGQGRSTFEHHANGTTPYLGYDQMTDDLIAVLDKLHVHKAALVGWSDGAIQILDVLFRYPERLGRAFAFAANYDVNGTATVSSPIDTTAIEQQTEDLYNRLNPQPNMTALEDAVVTMWYHQPSWTQNDFRRVATSGQPTGSHNSTWVPTKQDPGTPNPSARVWLVDAADEEAVKLPQLYTMSHWLPQSPTLLLPGASHFALLQDPVGFNGALDSWLAYTVPQ